MSAEYDNFQRLIDLRKGKKKTIADMAYESGLSASTISNYERGVRIPDGKALIKLANYFNVSADYLIGLNNVRNEEHLAETSSKIDSLYKTLSKVPDCVSDDILNLMNRLVTIYLSLGGFKDESKRAICWTHINSALDRLWVGTMALRDEPTTETIFSELLFAFLDAKNSSIRAIINLWDMLDERARELCTVPDKYNNAIIRG